MNTMDTFNPAHRLKCFTPYNNTRYNNGHFSWKICPYSIYTKKKVNVQIVLTGQILKKKRFELVLNLYQQK